jgi:hypothetical protein
LWHYRTKDSPEQVEAQGYFDGASKMLRVGDFILINAGTAHGMTACLDVASGRVEIGEVSLFGTVAHHTGQTHHQTAFKGQPDAD